MYKLESQSLKMSCISSSKMEEEQKKSSSKWFSQMVFTIRKAFNRDGRGNNRAKMVEEGQNVKSRQNNAVLNKIKKGCCLAQSQSGMSLKNK